MACPRETKGPEAGANPSSGGGSAGGASEGGPGADTPGVRGGPEDGEGGAGAGVASSASMALRVGSDESRGLRRGLSRTSTAAYSR